MNRMVSTFAMAGWTGYHAVCAMSFAAPGVIGASLDVASTAGPVSAGASLTAAAHAMFAIGALASAAMLPTVSEHRKGEALGLAVLAAGIALAAAAFLASGMGEAPGLYAACLCLTLAALSFDRRVAETQDGEVDHEAFMRCAAELGAQMGQGRESADRIEGARR